MSDTTQQPSPSDRPVAAPEAATPTATPHRNLLADMISRVTLTQLTLMVLAALFVWQWLDAHRQLGQTQQEVARRLSRRGPPCQAMLIALDAPLSPAPGEGDPPRSGRSAAW